MGGGLMMDQSVVFPGVHNFAPFPSLAPPPSVSSPRSWQKLEHREK